MHPNFHTIINKMTSEFKELCRICLTKVDNMRYLLNSSNVMSELMSMLSSIVNSKINLSEGLPSYMCFNCEEKLKISYEFQQLSQKSHQVISEYIETLFINMDKKAACVTVVEFASDEPVKDVNVETLEGISIICGESNDNCNSEDENQDENLEKPQVKKKTKIKLSQHDPEEVMNLIKETKLKFYEAKECLLCSFTGMNNRALSLHMTRNHGEFKDRWCRQCNKIEEALTDHMKNIHKDELKCPFCGKKSRTSSHLVEHLLYHSVQHQFTCQTCNKSFISARHLKYHTKIHQIICEICSETFLDKYALLSHSKIHKVLKCKICSESFTKENYDKHVCFKEEETLKDEHRSEIQLDQFCPDCNEDVEDLDKHMKIHHNKDDEIKGLCTYCGKQFKNQSYLTVHLKRHTKETPYKCRYCDTATVTKAHLQEHERTHTGEKPYVCKFCGKSKMSSKQFLTEDELLEELEKGLSDIEGVAFIQRSILSTHLKIHTGRTEQCHLCPKKFCRPSELRNHMRKHTGEKPYACNYCERTFIQKSHLTEHLKIHTDDRPFKCHLCDKAFKQTGTLKAHINIHEGKNVYKCEICSYTCRKSYTLTLHIRQHQNTNNQENYKCDKCEEIFNTEEALTEHLNNTNHENVHVPCDTTKNMKYEEFLDQVKI